MFKQIALRRHFSSFPAYFSCNPYTMSKGAPHSVQNLCSGEWHSTAKNIPIIDPMNGETFMTYPKIESIQPFQENIRNTPKSGLFNIYKNSDMLVKWGEINRNIAQGLLENEDYFVKLIQRVMPKSDKQCRGEVIVTRKFFENFAGDNVRFLMKGFSVAGDHPGQMSHGTRFPYGAVSVICPFNFPLEIPALQAFGALMVGNHVTLKADQRVAVVMEQFLKMCIDKGMDPNAIDLIGCDNTQMEQIVRDPALRMTQFTGSSKVAEHLMAVAKGKVKIEDAGYDWKVFGPEITDLPYAVYQSDQDAYGQSGQKCSAQSIAFLHKNWVDAGFIEKIAARAAKRNLQDLSIGPVLSWTNAQIQAHIEKLLKIEGAKVLFGGKALKNHEIPEQYGAFEPTAVYVPLKKALANFDLVQTEVFGPFQIITDYQTNELPLVLECLEKMDNHLTCGIVSNDPQFLNQVLGETVNGVTYCGARARTTGAPQNHWFGPAGDPRGTGIGTKEAILNTWTCHREIVMDVGNNRKVDFPEPF